jgi:hypothetical protein
MAEDDEIGNGEGRRFAKRQNNIPKKKSPAGACYRLGRVALSGLEAQRFPASNRNQFGYSRLNVKLKPDGF